MLAGQAWVLTVLFGVILIFRAIWRCLVALQKVNTQKKSNIIKKYYVRLKGVTPFNWVPVSNVTNTIKLPGKPFSA